MRILLMSLILVIIGLQYKLWLGDGSLLQWHRIEEALVVQEEANEKLAVQNSVLEADIQELKNGQHALEEQARSELGMIKKNETYFHFLKVQ